MLIRNAPAQYLHQHMMVNVVKTSFKYHQLVILQVIAS